MTTATTLSPDITENPLLDHLHSDRPATEDIIVEPGALIQSQFKAWENKSFSIQVNSETHEFLLQSVEATVHPGKREEGGFSLFFTGPWIQDFYQGNVYLKFPDATGAILFLTCNGLKDRHAEYQIILS